MGGFGLIPSDNIDWLGREKTYEKIRMKIRSIFTNVCKGSEKYS